MGKVLKLGAFYEITWLDATGDGIWDGGWVTVAHLPEPVICKSYGVLVKDAPRYIVLAASVPGTVEPGDETFGNISVVPKGMVLKQKRISLMDRKSRRGVGAAGQERQQNRRAKIVATAVTKGRVRIDDVDNVDGLKDRVLVELEERKTGKKQRPRTARGPAR